MIDIKQLKDKPLEAIGLAAIVAILSGGSLSGIADAVLPDREAGVVRNASERLVAIEEAVAAQGKSNEASIDALRLQIALALETGNTAYLLAGLSPGAGPIPAPTPQSVEKVTLDAGRAAYIANRAADEAIMVQKALPIDVKSKKGD